MHSLRSRLRTQVTGLRVGTQVSYTTLPRCSGFGEDTHRGSSALSYSYSFPGSQDSKLETRLQPEPRSHTSSLISTSTSTSTTTSPSTILIPIATVHLQPSLYLLPACRCSIPSSKLSKRRSYLQQLSLLLLLLLFSTNVRARTRRGTSADRKSVV